MPSLSHSNPFAPNASTRANPPAIGGVRTIAGNDEAQFKGEYLWVKTWSVSHANAVALHRYPGVPGQTVEALGREPYTIDMDAAFFGDGWQARKDNVIFLADAEQTSGDLVLPDGRMFSAFLVTATEEETAEFDGCTLRLQFVEDAHVDAYFRASDDPISQAEQNIPADDYATCGEQIEAFTAAVREPEEHSDEELTLALRTADIAAVAAQDALDTSGQDGVDRFDDLLLVRYYMRAAAPAGVDLSAL